MKSGYLAILLILPPPTIYLDMLDGLTVWTYQADKFEIFQYAQ